METKQCNVCGEYKDKSEYAPSTWKQPKHYTLTCRECARKKEKERLSHPVRIKKGYIYIITNKAWPGWCKIGLTTQTPEGRLTQYQTASPFRDYEVYASKKVNDTIEAERIIHTQLEEDGYSRNSEWFNIEPEDAFIYLEKV